MTLKLIQKIKYNEDEYKDIFRPAKGILTDVINNSFLKYNHNQLELMKEIYTTFNNSGITEKLIFKGGNVMNLINQNFMKYLQPAQQLLVIRFFKPFLKKSDNDFSIFIDPNIDNYDEYFTRLNMMAYDLLNKIRNNIKTNLSLYFNIFTLSKEQKKLIFDNAKNELTETELFGKVTKLKLNPINNQIILLDKAENYKSDINIYDYGKNKSFIYNSANFSLKFLDDNKNIIRFSLLRSKINFLINNSDNMAGELIDISFPHKQDYEMSKLNTKHKFDNYIKNNVFKGHTKDFTYYIVNNHYLVKDLYKILFETNKYPWLDNKYEKRIARLIYFIYLDYLNGRKVLLSQKTFNNMSNNFKQVIKSINNNKLYKNKIKVLNDITIATLKFIKDPNINLDDLEKYIKTLYYYIDAIEKINSDFIKIVTGKSALLDLDLFNLNI